MCSHMCEACGTHQSIKNDGLRINPDAHDMRPWPFGFVLSHYKTMESQSETR